MLRVAYMMLGSAVDDSMSSLVRVKIDDVVAYEVHGAMK